MLAFSATTSCRLGTPYKPKLITGTEAPDFKLINRENKYQSLSDFRGKLVILDFWASWCPPCRKANKDMVELYHEFKNARFENGTSLEIIGISEDMKKTAWGDAIKEDGLEWPTHLANKLTPGSNVAQLYDVQYIPTTYLISPEGVILLVNPGHDELKEELKKRLAK